LCLQTDSSFESIWKVCQSMFSKSQPVRRFNEPSSEQGRKIPTKNEQVAHESVHIRLYRKLQQQVSQELLRIWETRVRDQVKSCDNLTTEALKVDKETLRSACASPSSPRGIIQCHLY
jgi:hypothetical protein